MKKIRNAVDAECRETVRLDRPHTSERAYRDGSVRRAISGWPVLRLSRLRDMLRVGAVSSTNPSVHCVSCATKSIDSISRLELVKITKTPSQTPEKLPSRRRSQLLVDRDKPSGHRSVEPANPLDPSRT